MKPPVFIIGGSRTGSEMLKSILTAGPEIDMINEMFLLCPRWLHPDLDRTIKRHIGDLNARDDVDVLLELLYSGKPYGYFWTEIRDCVDREKLRKALLGSDLSLREVFASLLQEHAKKRGKEIAGAKFPLHYSRAAKLLEWFPDCKLIHTVRDPRAVYSSQMNKYVRDDFGRLNNAWIRLKHFVHIFIQVKWSTRIHNELQGRPNYMLSKYEDLVNDSESSIQRICDFLGVSVVPRMLSPKQYNSSFRQQQGYQGFDTQATQGWRSKLSKSTVSLINTLNHGELVTLGYLPEA